MNQLPPKSYREFIGRDIQIGSVMAALHDPSGKWMVAIDGIGGIGKTALAREAVDRCASELMFDTIIWDQASKESKGFPMGREKGEGTYTFETVLDTIARQLGASDIVRLKKTEKEMLVRDLLQAQRVLIVLDNLEATKESRNEIARRLLRLLNPSKALMTSRYRFQGDIYAVQLTGLDEDEALRFIHQEAQEKNIQNISNASPKELKQIAETTGGSPLALKLVVGQLGHLPLDTVLEQLRKVNLPTGESDQSDYYRFYKGIFAPFWKQLSVDAKKLLIAMTTFPPGVGGSLEALKAVSDLDTETLARSTDELFQTAFLEIRSSPETNQTRYYLHALIYHFVLSDVVNAI